ncbi:hypothetical protein COCC4DRAFT_126271 [Bipolaris maydis ATCC 48331]|uniref:BZIP domain-containing protein n=2 Tax=Cochliobolus heterostrophus TaxID=5016 RepID=M2SXL6_COCH5|nr:uncharacterized protein COCC4DRAFT_126271 [Bipolaris maydis ATCC 48331]EMD90130.1 hypothetical protein COCHEDRAFT_1178537 [Bipolaris maydis C5]ENI09656.1 hypothetical protein COCC4DRAFT_126271 [Bipolaris maydis ATCC 48331]KAJ6207952.1 hypothetical protein PSV09DRAFT_1178537 [Bipolaris maydis]
MDPEPKNAAPTQICITQNRKRPASEQERRERKRAIDRQAQRSLRVKTKIYIAKLERTIKILQSKDHNDATATLLSEIDALRAENEQLKHTIESVKSLVGLNAVSQDVLSAKPGPVTEDANHSSTAAAVGDTLPEPPTTCIDRDPQPSPLPDVNQSTSIGRTTSEDDQKWFDQPESPEQSDFFQPLPSSNGLTTVNQPTKATIDLDGMTLTPDPDKPVTPDYDREVTHSPGHRPLSRFAPEKKAEEIIQELLEAAPYSLMIQEILGSKVVLSLAHHSPHRPPSPSLTLSE